MGKLDDLKSEIKEAEREAREKALGDKRHEEVIASLDGVKEELSTIKEKTLAVEVQNHPEFPKEIAISNLKDTPTVDEVKVTNLKDIKIPEAPKEIDVKQPKWFTIKGITDAIADLKQTIIKQLELNLDRYTKKQNALAVKLVNKDGTDFYNAFGGGGGSYGGAATSTGEVQASLINTNEHTGNQELRVYQENHVCTGNTTTALLGIGGVFTGTWQDCLNYQEVDVTVFTDKASATNGLVVQWSADGVTVGDTDTYTIAANQGNGLTFNPLFRYVRIVYTNGATAQTTFNLMTILRRGSTKGSSHRISDSLRDQNDAALNLSVLKLRTAQDNYVSGAATNSGNFKVSVEEFPASLTANPLPTTVQAADSPSIDAFWVASVKTASKVSLPPSTPIFSTRPTGNSW